MSPVVYAISLLLMLASCGRNEEECVDFGDCDDLEICDLGTCVSVECVLSQDCGIDEYCDQTGFTCEAGCESNEDCIAGENCSEDTHECSPYGCRSTALDCAVGQECDLVTGTCYDSPSCEPCTGADSMECGAGACVDFDLENVGGDHCLMPCLVVGDPEECPRGLECRDLSGVGDLYCYADCPALQEELNDGP